MKIFLGIDGGGTGCRAWLSDETGSVWGRGAGPQTNYHHAGWDGAEHALVTAVEAAWQNAGETPRPADAAFLGLAGVTAPSDRERFKGIAIRRNLARRIEVDHDIRIALAGGLAGRPGIALIVGTGSACYGRAADGQTWQAGGWDAIADDVGSAYWLGLKAINRAVRAMDGRDPATSLQALVFAHFRITAADEIMQHLSGVSRREIAALAPEILQAAETDATANALCEEGARELALMVTTVAKEISPTPMDAITAGSLGLAPSYQARIRAALAQHSSTVTMTEALLPPVAGAVLLARELAGHDLDSVFIQTLQKNS